MTSFYFSIGALFVVISYFIHPGQFDNLFWVGVGLFLAACLNIAVEFIIDIWEGN